MQRNILLELRKSKGFTQEQVAKEANINRSHYGFIENGERNPSYEVAEKIADVFDVSVERAFPEDIFFGKRCYNKKHEDCDISSAQSDMKAG